MIRTISTFFISASLAIAAIASPVKGRLASDGVDYESRVEPQNTSYIKASPYLENACINTGVVVGYGTDFVAGSRIVFDVTLTGELSSGGNTMFAQVRNYGYQWCYLAPSENLTSGRYTVEWTNQPDTRYYHLRINGKDSLGTYQTYWQLGDQNALLYFGKRYVKGVAFPGLFHSIKLYDSTGRLRHHWMPDVSGVFYDVLEDVPTTVYRGSFIYGDLANE